MEFSINHWVPNQWKANQWPSINSARQEKSVQEREENGSQQSMGKRSSERVKLSPKLFLSSLNASPFHVIVLYENSFGPLSEEAIKHVQMTFRSIIRMTILQNGVRMRYESAQRNESGWFLLKCADECTVNWTLQQTISGYNGENFRIIRVSDLPKNVCISIKIPTRYLDAVKILEVLENQNDGLCTKEWKIVSMTRKRGKSGKIFVVISAVIPPKVLPFLHKVDWKPYFEFSRAVIVSHVPAPGQKGKVEKKITSYNTEITENDNKSSYINLISDDEEEKGQENSNYIDDDREELEFTTNRNEIKINSVSVSNSSSLYHGSSELNVKLEDSEKNIQKKIVIKVEDGISKNIDYISLVSDDEDASSESMVNAESGKSPITFDPNIPSTSWAWNDPVSDDDWTDIASNLVVVEVCTLDESSVELLTDIEDNVVAAPLHQNEDRCRSSK